MLLIGFEQEGASEIWCPLLYLKKGDFVKYYKAKKIDGVKCDEHRILMEQHLGRKLEHNEVVHHINGNKFDNELSNLKVMTRSEHSRLHQSGKKASPDTLKKMSAVSMGNTNGPPRKLTPEQVRYVRDSYIPGDPNFGVRALARKFNISHSKISYIINSKTYRDIV